MGPLRQFAAQTIRVVVRPTSFYAALLERARQPSNLKGGVEWSLHFDFVSRFVDWEDPAGDPLAALLPLERQAMCQLDIPLILSSTDSRQLEVTTPFQGPLDFEGASMQQIETRVRRLSPLDAAEQSRLIEHALELSQHGFHHTRMEESQVASDRTAPSLTREAAITRACQQAEVLRDAATCSAGGAAWLGITPLPGRDQGQMHVLGHDLYAGNAGIALFLSALYRVTGEESYRELALMAIAPIEAEFRDQHRGVRLARAIGIGGGAGIGSLIYALARTGIFLDRTDVVEGALAASALISEEALAENRHPDVLLGAAGALLGLLALHDACPGGDILNQALACGTYLQHTQIQSGPGAGGWAGEHREPLTGFSHGAGGIAYALCRLFTASGRPEFLTTARAAIAYQHSTYSHEHRNWPDFRVQLGPDREPDYSSYQWCHGAAGIGLAGLGGLDALDTDDVHSDIEAALQRTCAIPLGSLDHLCCGNFGRLEVLFYAGLRLTRRDLKDLALHLANSLIANDNAAGRARWLYGDDRSNPGFFTGISGVGYELLRLTHPDRLPCVLLWE